MQLRTTFIPARFQLSKLTAFIAAAAVYVLLTLAVLFWYQDDVEQMTWVDREVFNHKIISQYQLSDNISQQQVLNRLGSPDITSALHQDNALYQVLYYRTHRNTADGITTADECTALLFKDRRLIAIGDTAAAQYQTLTANAD
jgi:outer membrane protein assembly factor BamE (lipoprotein component of BamABCDE complex)